MEDQVITACYGWTEDEYLASYEMHCQVAGQPSSGKGGAGSSLLLAALFVPLWIVLGILALREPGIGFNDVLLVLLIVASAAFLFFRSRARPANPPAAYAGRKDGDQTVCYTFSAEGIAVKTDIAASSLSWDRLSMVARSSRGFLFYRDDTTFHWAPTHAFAPGDADRVGNLARSRVGKYLEM